ncbi:MAG: DUF4340 domain-containing protein [Oscillospiraceae bacterium]|nr:DUF4340 domain-containing protein [Oscillospiraceae bacterium]
MKKNIKAVIACAGVLVLAGGGYAALMLTDNAPDTSSVSSSDEPIATTPSKILGYAKYDVLSISVKNNNGEYVCVSTSEKDDEGMPVFTIEGIEDLDINRTLIDSLTNSVSALGCDDVVEENAADLEKYGLANPQAEVSIKATADAKTLLIGNESPTSGETYCMIRGEKTVYLAATSSLAVFLNTKENFLSTALIEASSDGNNPVPEIITIDRKDLDYDIVLEYDDNTTESGNTSGTLATHYMSEPVFSYLDVQKSQNATQGFFGLNAYSALYAHPDKTQLEASGLSDPFCTVSMTTMEGDSHTIKIGNKLNVAEGEYYSVMLDDIDVIYAVSAENLCWATLTPGDITSKMIFGTFVWDISKLEINVNGGESVLFTGSGTSADDYELTKNGEKADAVRFQKFYQYLLKTSAEDFVIDEQPQGEPTVSIELETQDGTVNQTVEFYKADGKKSLIVVDGTPCFKCRTAYVDLLIENLAKFDTNEEFVMNW